MDRNVLLKQIGEETRSATLAYYAYMHADREYVKDQKLYLREMHFLLEVGRSSSITVTETAEKLEVSQGAATQIATRLIKKNLIVKEKSMFDRRYTVIQLTPLGQSVYDEYLVYDKIRRNEINQRFEEFTEDELKAILRYQIIIKEICK